MKYNNSTSNYVIYKNYDSSEMGRTSLSNYILYRVNNNIYYSPIYYYSIKITPSKDDEIKKADKVDKILPEELFEFD